MLSRFSPKGKAWRIALTVSLLVSVLSIAACTNLGYYGQAAWGQTEILVKRRSIERLVVDPATPEKLREQLAAVLRIRQFALGELRLPDNGSYKGYVELGFEDDGSRRRFVVWNVVAAPELSTAPLTWCFPVAGCVSYRGYFSRVRADKLAQRLDHKGYDVAVSGTSAYSTLGWFKDPVLSTVIDYPELYLAGLLFHELAHQVVYVKDDTRFNESFATTVEVEGVRRWLEATGRRGSEMDDYLARMRREEQFAELVLDYGARLGEAYAADADASEKRRRKAELFEDLRGAYGQLRISWEGYEGYDSWFDRELNNAHLVSVGAYHGFVPGFQKLLERHGGDLGRFYEAVRELGEREAEEREELLNSRTQ